MKRLKFLVGTLLINGALVGSANAQDHVYNWSAAQGSSGTDVAQAVTTDLNSNVISVGSFLSTVDFDPGTGNVDLTSQGGTDIVIQKLDANGDIVWAHSIGSTSNDEGLDVETDLSGNIYVSGYFRGTVDFDPGTGVSNFTSNGGSDIFVLKLDASGNYVWAATAGASLDDTGRDIAIDPSGNVITTGFFRGTMDADPGTGTTNLVSNGAADMFVQKLDANGNFVWAFNCGAGPNEDGYSIAADGSGNVYVSGYFSGTVDFDPGIATQNLVSNGGNDNFLVKYDASGNYVWGESFGAAAYDAGNDVLIDANNNVVLVGRFAGTVDFDPGIGTQNLTAVGGFDIFAAKFDQNGQLLWAHSFGDTQDDEGYCVAIDPLDNVYVSGFFRGTVDFDSGIANTNTVAEGGADIFVLKLNSSGGFEWVKSIGSTGNDHGFEVNYAANNDLLIAGYFSSPIDMDPGSGTASSTSVGGSDYFVLNLNECIYDATTNVINTCGAYTWIDGVTYTSSNYTATHTLTNVGGCDSIVSLHLTISSITDETVTPSVTTICDNGAVTVSTGSSQAGVNYYLRDDSDDSVIDGPIVGDGNGLTFNAGSISNTTTYNVYAELENDHGVTFTSSSFDRLEVANPYTDFTDEITVEAWVFLDNATITDEIWITQALYDVDQMSSNVWLWATHFTGELEWHVNNGGTWISLLSSSVASLSGWHHIATTADASGTYIYVDGVLDASTTSGVTSGIQSSPNATLHIGNDVRYPNDVNRHGDFGISEIRIWDEYKSQSEISADMSTCLNGNESGLVYFNKMNNNSGTVATASIGEDALFSTNMDASDWINANNLCDAECTFEMSQMATVTVNSSTAATQTVSSCVEYTWPENSMTYTTSGMYTETITNVAGCDSVITLDLTITTPSASSFDAGDCVSYTVPSGDETYTMSGVYMDTIPNMAGCDSVMTINVTIGASPASISETACFTYTVPSGDETYTMSGIYNDTIPSMGGCDSIITIDLTINTVNVDVTVTDPSITADAAGAAYQWLDCDNAFGTLTGETSQMFTATENGNYAVQIIENGCVDTSTCTTISTVGLSDVNGLEVKIYPNPTQGNVWIEVPNLESNMRLTIYSMDGKVLVETTLNSAKELINLDHLASGYYTLVVSNEEQKFINKIRLF